MPNSINDNSPQEQLEAVGTLIYHVEVSVDMNYRPTSSGAVTGKLCERMPLYFDYTNHMDNLYREDYTHEDYMQLIVNSIDMDWPMVHRGGGHAYVLDGYNDYDQVHFNWGWGGSSDGWFNIDDHGYTDGESVIYNYVPAEIYAATSKAPTDLNVVPATDASLSALVTWKNPTLTLTDATLTTIDEIVVVRNGQAVFSEDSVMPGAEMSFVDETIPYYDGYDYAVYAIVNGQRGASAVAENNYVGPTCDWKIIMQSSFFQGWSGGYVSLYSAAGTEISQHTLTSSTPVTYNFSVPLGHIAFGWTAPNDTVNNITFTIKDADGNIVYNYTGSTSGLDEGVFLTFNNDCGFGQPMGVPYDLIAQDDDNNVILTWNSDAVPSYGFNVYRDEQLYALVREGTTFTDEDIDGGHCYMVTALGEGGESDYSNETCASTGDCMAPSNLYFEYVGNNFKIKLSWDKPENHDALSGYYLFRKQGENGTYERIKLISASSTSYTDNSANVQGDYYYRLYAYYASNDCTSSPASVRYNPNLFYLHVYYSPTDLEELEKPNVSLYPNPVDQMLQIEADDMMGVTVCNILGQVVCQRKADGNILNINVSGFAEGLYTVAVSSRHGTTIRRFSVLH